MIPVSIISGFLGAGKTTLLRRILSEPQHRRVGVLVNDFGALNIDADVISEVQDGVVSLSNGCVCCSIRDDLVDAVERLLAIDVPPEQIVVETSGISDPGAVANAFFARELTGRLIVHSICCVVDVASFSSLDYTATELAIDQAAVSDVVLLNKCDLVPASEIDKVEHTLRDALPSMRIVRTVQAEVPPQVVFGWTKDSPQAAHGRTPLRQSPSRSTQFSSWSWTSDQLLELTAFKEFVAQLPLGVFRAKGVLFFSGRSGERALFQLVGRRSSLDFVPSAGEEAINTLVAIGAAEAFDRGALDQSIQRCLGREKYDVPTQK